MNSAVAPARPYPELTRIAVILARRADAAEAHRYLERAVEQLRHAQSQLPAAAVR